MCNELSKTPNQRYHGYIISITVYKPGESLQTSDAHENTNTDNFRDKPHWHVILQVIQSKSAIAFKCRQ